MTAERRDMKTEERDKTRDEALRAAMEQMSVENLTTTNGIRVDIVRDDIDAPRERVWDIA